MKQILSPLPGIFYRKPSPDADCYKVEGEQIQVGDVVGLIEVMKSFYEVKAETSGKILNFLVENEGVVTAAQPLVEVDT